MSRHLSRARVRRTRTVSAAAVATCASVAGVLSASPAHAGLTVNLQFPNGSTTMLIGGDQTNTDIPVQVWATVTGVNPLAPVPTPGTSAAAPATTGVFDGLQYLYYNILNSNSTGTLISGGVSSAPLNATLGFNGNGAQTGAIANVSGGISVGSNTSVGSIAKPRANKVIFDNYANFNATSGLYTEYGGDNANIKLTSNSASFLVQTINFHPSAYSQRNKTTFSVNVPSAAFITTNSIYAPSNYFQDTTSQTGGPQGQPLNGLVATSPTAGTQVVIQDTLAGDANLNGTVNSADLLIVAQNYNTTGKTFATGDFTGDGIVNSADLLALAQNYNQTINPITPSLLSSLSQIASPAFVAEFQADLAAVSAVPEPASLSVVAIVGGTMLARRRRNFGANGR